MRPGDISVLDNRVKYALLLQAGLRRIPSLNKSARSLAKEVLPWLERWMKDNHLSESIRSLRSDAEVEFLDEELRSGSYLEACGDRLFVHKKTLLCALDSRCVCCCYKILVSIPKYLRGSCAPNARPEMCPRFRQCVSPSASDCAEMYSHKDKILIVGDGDLTFSCAVAGTLVNGRNITATTYLSKKELHDVYGPRKIAERIRMLENSGNRVVHSVDATQLGKIHGWCPPDRFTRVVWNFPCVAPPKVEINTAASAADGQNSEMELNRTLLREFFATVHRVLHPLGEVHVTHKTKPPYSQWNILELASKARDTLEFVGCFVFDKSMYPGYRNRKARCGTGSFPVHDARVFIFRRRADVVKGSGFSSDVLSSLANAVKVDTKILRRAHASLKAPSTGA
eukprot:g2024.t1